MIKPNKDEWFCIALLITVGLFIFLVLEQSILSDFIDDALQIPLTERHD